MTNSKDLAQEQKDISQADTLIKKRTLFGVRPKKVSGVINRLLAKKGIAQSQFNEELRTCWKNAAGDKWYQLTLPGKISRGVLEVTVANAMVNQQLTFKKRQLLKQMQQMMPESNLKDIRFRVGKVD